MELDELLRVHDESVRGHPLAGMEAMNAAAPGMVPAYKIELRRWRDAGSLGVPQSLLVAFAASDLSDKESICVALRKRQAALAQPRQKRLSLEDMHTAMHTASPRHASSSNSVTSTSTDGNGTQQPAGAIATPFDTLRSPGRRKRPSSNVRQQIGQASMIGARVRLGNGWVGVVRFVGQTNFADGEWVGIELDEAYGKNHGSVHGVSYFSCAPDHGVFVRPDRVKAVIAFAPAPEPLSRRRASSSSGKGTSAANSGEGGGGGSNGTTSHSRATARVASAEPERTDITRVPPSRRRRRRRPLPRWRR